jgi:transcriptional regulator with XRE-family HTH domain
MNEISGENAARDWNDYAKRLGIQLNRARHQLAYSQERVAYAAGLTRSHYQQLEKGESAPGTPANPRLKTLVALAQVLHLSLTELLPDDPPDMTEGR